MKLTGDDLLKELRHHEEAYQSLIHGPLCGCAADRIEALAKALEGTLCELSCLAMQMAARGWPGREGGSVSRAQKAARDALSAVGTGKQP